MPEITVKAHRTGTHRVCAPAATLERVSPIAPRLGITRCADITGLDTLGIPVYVAVRPRGHYLQTSTGKGFAPVDAKVSSLMEAIEHWHAEQLPDQVTVASPEVLASASGRRVVPGREFSAWRDDVHDGPRRVQQWIEGEELQHRDAAWLPAGAACVSAVPQFFTTTTNGLASGNTRDEATAHALYEVLERDVISRLLRGGRLRLSAPRAARVRTDTVEGEPAELIERIRRAGVNIALVRIAAPEPVTVFWAVLLDQAPFHACTRVNFGYGAHLSPTIAAVRAITEAAQSRLSFIHGAREDLAHKIRGATDARVRPVFDYFSALPEELAWASLDDSSTDDIAADCAILLQAATACGWERVYRVDLTRPDVGVPVVKVLVPGAITDRRLF